MHILNATAAIFDDVDLVLKDYAEHAVIFIGDASGEKQIAIGQKQSPKSVKGERNSESIARNTLKTTRVRVVNIDLAVAKIADPKLTVYNFQSPRRIEPTI